MYQPVNYASPVQAAFPGGQIAQPGLAARGAFPVAAPTIAPQTIPAGRQGFTGTVQNMSVAAQPAIVGGNRIQQFPGQFLTREQALEQRVRELESLLAQKDKIIQELKEELGGKGGSKSGANSKVRSPGRGGTGFRKVAESKPVIRYTASDQDDPIDVRLEEFYNSTGSAIQFRRINRGFYRFGDTIVELDIINHKLMSRTEDGWNRGKFGPIEKFIMYYENIEREKAGILPDA